MKKPARVLQLILLSVTFSFGYVFALAQSPSVSGGWYTAGQAVNGAKAYQKTCAGCHGAKLQGGMGPSPCRQAILAHLWWQEGLDSVVRRSHADADDGARIGPDEKLHQYHGIPVAEERRTRRHQAA